MRLSHLFSVVATVLLLPGVVVAEESVDSANSAGPDVVQAADTRALVDAPTAEPFDDPGFDAVDEVTTTVETGPAVVTASGVVLGPEGIDDEGRRGRLHTVAKGDTLWDLSAAYLGTPWVWPSVWTDNGEIANPHLILPGNKIWITANAMRVVTDAEAESFLVPVVEETPVAAMDMQDFAEESSPPLAALDADDEPSSMEAFPVAVPGQAALDTNRQVTVSSREMMGFVTAETLAGASSIVGSSSERTYLSALDPVFVGLGEGDVEVGDQFTIFRVVEEIRDVETNRVLGHHVEHLGWIEVQELTGDTSIGIIHQAYAEILRGSRLVRREKVSRSVNMRITPDAIEGQIVFLPSARTVMADGGYVYLNRGEFHGIEVGSELEVFDSGETVNDRERRVDVRTPDSVVATIVVVSVESESSVAFVLNASRELMIGDSVRPAVSQLAKR